MQHHLFLDREEGTRRHLGHMEGRSGMWHGREEVHYELSLSNQFRAPDPVQTK